MKKSVLITLLVSFLILLRTSSACALVIYDWVTYGTNPGDSGCGFEVTAQWAITEQEYWDGLFFVSVEDRNEKIQASAQVDLSDGSTWLFTGVPLQPPMVALWGSLSADRTRIGGIGEVGPKGTLVPDNLHFFAPDDSLIIGTNRARGGILFPMSYFNDRHPLTGDWRTSTWDLNGEWVARQETVPIPEPGTIILLGLGIGGIVLWCTRSA